MGTYGVTHIKKNGKTIPLSDSYDGYFSGGMGQANLYTIKYLDDSLLARLFDRFTAHLSEDGKETEDYDDEEKTITQREIEEAIFNFNREPNVSEEAKVWFEESLNDDLRTSKTGAGPLLYLNFYNHYGRNYDYADWIIDLDNKTYSLHGCPVSFEQIRKLSGAQIDFISQRFYDEKVQEFDLNAEVNLSHLIDEYYSATDENNITPEQTEKLKAIQQQVNDYFENLANIDNTLLDAYFAKKEEERLKQMAEYNQQKSNIHHHQDSISASSLDTEEEDNDDFGAYSVRTARDLTPVQMRKILVLCNKLEVLAPEAHVLLKNAMWGMEEDFQSGGISFYSPRSRNQAQQDCYEATMNVIEGEFKIGFNIMSTAGASYKYAHEVSDQDRDNPEFGGVFGTAVIEPCCYSVAEIKENNPGLLDYMHPWLAYHASWTEVREEVLKEGKEMDSPLVWLYMAVLYQDKAVFDAVSTRAMQQFNSVDAANQKKVSATILASVADGVHVQKLVNSLAQISSAATPSNPDDFINHLKEQQFFSSLEVHMNNSEKAKYLEQNSSTGKKKKP